jgi:spore coat protein U-like protein
MNRYLTRNAIILPLICLALHTAKADTVSDTFQVKLIVEKSCTVMAGSSSDINLGTHPATDTNIQGNNTISVNCSKTTPYYIGLAPSNANTTGAGVLAGVTSGNTDTIPYQLRQASGLSGAIWGDTATSADVGNGVTGSGTGANDSYTVYVTVPSANFTPDSYADTVAVHVNF